MRQTAPAAERNKDAILEVLRDVLPQSGDVLEIASGTGQHVCHFATHLPHLRWHPTDRDPAALASIDSYREHLNLSNVAAAVALDVQSVPWVITSANAVVCINMIHISPWESCVGLVQGASAALPLGAPLFLYGPFRIGGQHTAPSNASFDAGLRARDPRWGVRDLDELNALGQQWGFGRPTLTQMPANNLCVVLRRSEPKNPAD